MASLDKNFKGGTDRITYRIPVTGAEKPFTLSARLLFQAVGYRFVEDLRGDTSPLIDYFGDLYDEADKTPEIVDSIEVTVPRALRPRQSVPR